MANFSLKYLTLSLKFFTLVNLSLKFSYRFSLAGPVCLEALDNKQYTTVSKKHSLKRNKQKTTNKNKITKQQQMHGD